MDTTYALVLNGHVTQWPLTAQHIKARGHSLTAYTPVTEKEKPLIRQRVERLAQRPPTFENGVLTQQWNIVPRPLDTIKEELTAELAAHRYEVETGGVTLPDGSRILTDRESQAQLTSAYQSLSMPFVESIEWKAAEGWVTVTEAELRPIAQAVAQHVQGCFKAERIVSEQIAAAENAEALYGIDVAGALEKKLESIKNI